MFRRRFLVLLGLAPAVKALPVTPERLCAWSAAGVRAYRDACAANPMYALDTASGHYFELFDLDAMMAPLLTPPASARPSAAS